MRYQTKKSFADFKKKNNFTLTYVIEDNVTIRKIDCFIDNILNKKNSFIFESVEKAKNRGRYTIFGFDPDIILEINSNSIFINKKKNLKQKKTKKFSRKFY